MRHNWDGRKLNRTASHRKAMLRNMVTSLFANERIHTTAAKAKEARRLAERMITFARRGDLAARRHVARTVNNPGVLQKLFDEIGPRYVDRPGGYTRVLKTGTRRGDGASTAILELVGTGEEGRKKKKKGRKKYHKVEVPEAPKVAVKEKAVEAEAAPEDEAGGEKEKTAGAAVERASEETTEEKAAVDSSTDAEADKKPAEAPAEGGKTAKKKKK
jgi:large subunit ribosomal protein L17